MSEPEFAFEPADHRIQDGAKQIGRVIGTLLITSLTVIVHYNLVIGQDRLRTQVVRFSLTALLSFYLYRGSNLARILTAALSALGLIGFVFAGWLLEGRSDMAWTMYLQAAGYGYCVLVLLFSDGVKAYCLAKRGQGDDRP